MKSRRTGRDILNKLDCQLGHSILNAQAILNEVKEARPANTPKEENTNVTVMKNAKRSLSIQDDQLAEQILLTIPLLINWSLKLLTPSQEALMILLQDSDFGKTHSPIFPFFKYLGKGTKNSKISKKNLVSKTSSVALRTNQNTFLC